MVREFDAPPERVWHAATEPELVVQWLGPRRNEMRLDVWDVRPGGSYRYLHITPDGRAQRFRGVYHQVVPNELAIRTFEWEGAPDQVSLETVRYQDLGGRTRMTHPLGVPVASRRSRWRCRTGWSRHRASRWTGSRRCSPAECTGDGPDTIGRPAACQAFVPPSMVNAKRPAAASSSAARPPRPPHRSRW